MGEELRPCKCGEDYEIYLDSDDDHTFVVCFSCGAKGPNASRGFGGDAIDEWNRRMERKG